MWLSSEKFWKMVEGLALANERTRVAEAKVAAMQATQDWLTTHVNRLENERRILTEARLGLSLPQPIIEKVSEQPESIEPDRETMRGIPHDSVPLAQMMAASLEDVGDEAAAALGITHDPHGFVQYKQ